MSIVVSNVYLEGTLVKVAFTFTDETQSPPVLADPTTISFEYTINNALQSVLTYPSGAIIRVSTGSFYVTLDTSNQGDTTWNYSFISTGVQGAGEGKFYVEAKSP